ncbi:SusC/RagA family TonB-linked outer membrane protein [Chryseolinea lacunae]|uniref:TonB-dependent receptor n=1 Tax=Chryseolinea lacunae TaxID=2801331 RepID=A0ABS1KZB1_9BACT|nr:TonB-dependent receptor [Chryseolinea lacunae]MBL0744508.1 TonB-dependent receptor [Chryseolinea lacunae]
MKFLLRYGTLSLIGVMLCMSPVGVYANASGAMAMLQATTVTGTVSDDSGVGMPGVNVIVKGTSNGTTTDADGKYSIAVAGDASATLVFTFIGYLAQEQPLNGRSTVNVTLAADIQQLTEVVVVGYGTQRKKDITGSVASVSTKEVTELPVTNAQQALQGRIAGVDVVSTGTTPGSGVSVRIRGRRSFNAGNDPLYVLDGIPLAGGIGDINPQDIQSMDVLKDASATAIYGSRGANGVVLITTKRGSTDGKTKVTYDGYYGVSSSLGNIDMMDGAQFAEYKRESRRATGTYDDNDKVAADKKLFEPTELEGIQSGRTTDYQDLIIRNGHQQNHQIGILGGNENTQFAVSANYFNDVGIVPNQDFTRATFRINLDHKFGKRFKIGTSTLTSYNKQNGDGFNPIPEALLNNPLGNPYNADGSLNFLPTTDGLRSNPLNEIVPGAIVREDKRMRVFTSFYAEAKIIEGLTYRINFGPDFQNRRKGEFTGSLTNARRKGDPTARGDNWSTVAYTLENVVNYAKTIGSSNFNVTGLYSLQRQTDEYYTTQVRGVPAEYMQFENLGAAPIIEGVGSIYVDWAIQSYMGRVNYSFKDKYLLTITGRADGSSRFADGRKYGFFPSAAVGWNIIEEDFMKGIPVFTNLKLRASYGKTGNTGIDPYRTLGDLERTRYAFGNSGAYGYRPRNLKNPDLKWETTVSANIGLDFGLFNGRVQGSLDFYVQNTSDLLMEQQLPANSGTSNLFLSNVGKTRNKGIELSIGTVNIDNGNFKWTTDFNIYANREAIVNLYGGTKDDIGNGWFIGQPMTVFFDYQKVGIWQTAELDQATQYQRKPGEIKVADLAGRDANGNLVAGADGKINADDRTILGSDVPDWTGGMTNRFSYKGFDFSFFIYTRQGGMIRSLFHSNYNNLFGRYNNLDVNYWTPNNPSNDYPRPNQNQEFPVYGSSLTYFDGSFVKIRNITFGYTLPKGISERLHLESVRIYASAQNPFIFASYRSKYKGIDPEFARTPSAGRERTAELDASTPASKLILFGINLKL